MADEVRVPIGADFKKAIAATRDFAKDATKSLRRIQQNFDLLKTAAIAAVGALAIGKIKSGIQSLTEAASAQEDAIKQLNTALQLSGDFTEEASTNLQEFASNLQAASTIGDEVALTQLALAKSFGVTNDQAKDLVQAAADLSAATGISLDSAVRNLGKTFGGLTGELGEVVPALKGLTKEQLEAGGAIDFVANRFGGAAQALTQTFSGAVAQTQNTFGDLIEEIGFFITQNPVFIRLVNQAGQTFANFIKVLQENREEIIEFINSGLKGVVSTVPFTIGVVEALAKGFGFLTAIVNEAINILADFLKIILEFEIVKTVINAVAISFKTLGIIALDAFSAIISGIEAIPGASALFGDLGVNLESARESLQGLGDELKTNLLQTDVTQDLNAGLDAVKQGSDAAAQSVADIGISLEDTRIATEGYSEALFATNNQQKKNSNQAISGLRQQKQETEELLSLEKQRQATQAGLGQGPIDFAGFEPIRIESEEAANQIGRLAGLAGNLFKGAAGARQVFGQIAGAFGDAFIPGIGPVVNQIAQVLAQGPEAVEEFIQGFIDEIPVIIDNVAKAIPVVIQTLIENLDVLVQALVTSTPRIISALVAGIPDIIDALIEELPQIIDAFINGLVENVDTIITSLAVKAPEIITKLAEEAPRIITSLTEKIPEVVDRLVEEAPRIIQTLIDNAPEIINALVIEMPKISTALQLQMPFVALELAKNMPKVSIALAKQSPFIARELARSIVFEVIPSFRDELLKIPGEIISSLREGLKDIVPGIGGIGGGAPGGVLGQVTGAVGGLFQDGGVIPAGFPNDSFLAGLSSGERVLTAQENQDIVTQEQFQRGIQQIVNALQGRQQASVSLNVDGKRLADTLVDLNQAGFRTA